ncbi:MAG: hypothetical protein ACJ0GD_02460 [Candidatus Actinomarina sp.]|jgi:uncharacterized membrane protein (DUF106 family)|tara:strand:- start:714 stop:932 length:219 start_codon:yes stop_codon:yes gene_type:complete
MKDKLPSKFTGFFIALIGSGMILSLISSGIDKLFLKNSNVSLLGDENFELVILVLSILIALLWLFKIRNLKD